MRTVHSSSPRRIACNSWGWPPPVSCQRAAHHHPNHLLTHASSLRPSCAGSLACRSSAIPVVTCVLAILVESRYPSSQELAALITLTLGVMLAVWQGTATGKPYAIMFCVVGTVCNGAMMTFSGKVLRCAAALLSGGQGVGLGLPVHRLSGRPSVCCGQRLSAGKVSMTSGHRVGVVARQAGHKAARRVPLPCTHRPISGAAAWPLHSLQ